MHAESNIPRWDDSISTFDGSVESVFNWAADQLLRGAPEVKVWVSGPRNVPVTLTRDNYGFYRDTWVES